MPTRRRRLNRLRSARPSSDITRAAYTAIEYEKIPTSGDNYVGIEFEFGVRANIDRDELRDKLIEFGLAWNCHIGYDSSIDTESMGPQEVYTDYDWDDWSEDSPTIPVERTRPMYIYDEHELRLLTTEKELKKNLSKLKQFFEWCEPEVNTSCGLHVHLDMRNRDSEKCYKKLLKAQDQMFKMQPKIRHQNEHAGRRATATSFEKYRAINRSTDSQLRTIEVRIHEGTTNTTDVYNWVKFLISIIESETKAQKYTKKVFKNMLSKSIYNYMERREKRYA